MKTLFRILSSLIILVVVLLVLAAVYLSVFFDPNDFKDELATAVRTETGRTLDISGDIKLSLFPWLGIDVGRTALGNAPDFADPVFASTEKTEIRVKLMPLLKKQLEMDTVTLHGLTLKLARDKNGRTNWDDLTGPKETTTPQEAAETKPEEGPQEGGGLPLASLAIGGLDVQDAHIEWSDEQVGQRYVVNRLALQSSAIIPGKPIQLDMSFHVEGGAPQMSGDVALKGELALDPAAQRYQMRDLAFTGQLSGEAVPVETLDVTLNTQAKLDLAAQTLTLSELVLKTLGVEAQGAVSAERVLEAPRYNASLKVPAFSPKKLMERLGQPSIETADPAVLQHLSLSTRLSGDTTQATLEGLQARLDDTTLEGRVEIPRFEGPALRFDLTVDAIDADRYLPPPAEGEQATGARPTVAGSPAVAAGGAGGEVQLDTLRALDMDGQLRVGKLKISNLSITDIALTLTAKDGLIRLDPTEALLYGGNYGGHIHLDARGQRPKLSVHEVLTAIQAGPLFEDLLGKDSLRITGTGNITTTLSAAGADADSMVRTLNGHTAFSFLDGAVKGINVARMIRETKARLKGKPVPDSSEPEQTDFTELSGTIKFSNGVARNDDLLAKSPLLRVQGKGSADLPRDQLDYQLTTILVGTAKGQGGAELKDLEGVAIPIRFTGPLAKPDYKVELAKVIEQETKKRAIKKAEKKLEKELGKEQTEEIRDKVEQLLPGLFR